MNRTDAASVSRFPFPGALVSGAVAVLVLLTSCSITDESGKYEPAYLAPSGRGGYGWSAGGAGCAATGC